MSNQIAKRAQMFLILVATAAGLAINFGDYAPEAHSANPNFPGARKGPLIAGIGYGHTSTTSLASALRRFGLRTMHWAPQYTLKLMCLKLSGGKMPEPGAKLDENVSMEDAVKNFEWGWQNLSEADAILDEPVNVFWEYIYKRFPDTKFVLTKRNVTLWAESEYNWYDHDEDGNMMSTDRFKPYWRWCKKFEGTDCQDKLLEYNFGKKRPSKSDLIDAYNNHVEKVRKTIPASQLLEMDISSGDGWEKLAPFIGRKVPMRAHPREPKDFPHDCNGHCIHADAAAMHSGHSPLPQVQLNSLERVEQTGGLCRCDGDGLEYLDERLPFSSDIVMLQSQEENMDHASS